MKRLQRYYLFVGLPLAAVALAVWAFFPAIMSTVESNPYPQINYVIFVLIAFGCVQMVYHVLRINREGEFFNNYRLAVLRGENRGVIKSMIKDTKRFDAALLAQLIEELRNRAINSVQHSALEAEISRFVARQSRQLMLPQFMSGLMIGMGLLGTFIGLLGALAEIGKLIGSFDLSANFDDPVAALGELVTNLTGPMKAMGVAFSASLFGVAGSMIMGVLLVGVRSASAELIAQVQADTSYMLDITDNELLEAGDNIDQVGDALRELAEQSPILRALAMGLDQSERRVRELVQQTQATVAQLSAQTQATLSLVSVCEKQSSHQEVVSSAVTHLQLSMKQLVLEQTSLSQTGLHMVKAIEEQIENMNHQSRNQSHLSEQLVSGIHAVLAEQKAQQADVAGKLDRTLDWQQLDAQQRTHVITQIQSLVEEMRHRNETMVQALLVRLDEKSA
jgi:hypothetical protein